MSNAALIIENLADAGSVIASSEESSMPASLLISSPHVTDDLWRGSADPSSITLDLLADTTVDTAVLLGLRGLTANPTVRLRISTASGGSTSGDVYDSGVVASGAVAAFDLDYGMFVGLMSAPAAARFVRFDFAGSIVEAGRLVVGLREVVDYNFAPGATLGWNDLSEVRRSKGGQAQVWQQPAFRSAAINLAWVSNSQRWGLIETLGRVNGRHQDVLLILDPAADNLPQWTVWGLVTDQSPAAWTSIGDLYSKQIAIEERM